LHVIRKRDQKWRKSTVEHCKTSPSLSLSLSLSLRFVLNDPSMLEICLRLQHRLQPHPSSNQFELGHFPARFVFNLSIKKKNTDPR